jgi:acyl carrier protein
MVDRHAVLECVYHAIDETNDQLPPEDGISKSTTALLYGGAGPLDSLGLVTMIFALEKRIESEFGYAVSLMAESGAASEGGNDPFQSVATLLDWLTAILSKCKAAA